MLFLLDSGVLKNDRRSIPNPVKKKKKGKRQSGGVVFVHGMGGHEEFITFFELYDNAIHLMTASRKVPYHFSVCIVLG